MHRRTKQIGVVVGIVAIVFLATWPFWKSLYIRSASNALRERARLLVEQNPQLQAAWDQALQDKVLTRPEATQIVEQAGEKVGPEE